ncbi:hypothetical protein Dimus_006404, partial [Dionaea muscipula]
WPSMKPNAELNLEQRVHHRRAPPPPCAQAEFPSLPTKAEHRLQGGAPMEVDHKKGECKQLKAEHEGTPELKLTSEHEEEIGTDPLPQAAGQG